MQIIPMQVQLLILLILTSWIACNDKQIGNATTNGPLLLYSTKRDIRIVNTARNKVKPIILIKNLTDGAALDYHYQQKKICWADQVVESIQCVGFNLTTVSDKIDIITTGVITPDGLACDWFTSKLYWTDSGTKRIEVVSMFKEQNRKVLFWTDIDQPRAIVLDPSQGLMFWTDWGEIPKIERAGMDGNPDTRKIIVNDDIFWPNGLTLDYEKQFIYWVDGKLSFLKKMDYNGNNISIIVKSGVEYPYGVTHFNNKFYWTDWKKWSIYIFDRNGTKGKNATKEPKKFLHSDTVPMDIHVWDARRQPYQPHPCELQNGGCSHLCLLSSLPPHFTCACPIGIKLIDNQTCADKPQEMLLFATRTAISVIYLDSPDYTYRTLNLTDLKFSIAVEYDPIDQFIYWTDTTIKKIQRARLDGTEQSNVLSFEIDASDGIAIDWIARNIYWTDTGLDRIEVATLNGRYRRVIISDGLLNPRAIAVSPQLGWLFWSDWREKNPKIERANLDGSERRIIVSDKLGWPNGIALDLEWMKIYWCDAKNDIIEYSNMDGSDRRVLVNDNVPHPFGFSIMGKYLYWTDWQKRTISRVNKETGGDREIILDQIANIMGLKAINSEVQNSSETNPCGNNNGGCEQLCLFLHNTTYKCVCQIGYELLNDGKSCRIPDAFLIYAKNEAIGRVSIENDGNDMSLPIPGIKHASSIDFDINNMRIYWTDIKQRCIMRAYVNGSDPQKVVELGLTAPEGLAVDWVALNIYWSDPPMHKIEVARLDGSSRRVLVWKDDGVEPHSIALDPEEGYMYWTEWALSNASNSISSIKKAALDASSAKTIVSTQSNATGLTLDFERRRMYWILINTPTIMSSDFNGFYKLVVVREQLIKPVGLTLYKENIYWIDEIDENRSHISKCDKSECTNATLVQVLNNSTTDLMIIVNTKPLRTFNRCAVNNGDCSHLCLALPAMQRDNKAYTCACPTHYTLQNNTCIAPKQFIIYSHKNLVGRLLPDTSESLEAVLPIQGLKNIIAIDFDPLLKFLYWIEGKTNSIKKAKAIGTHISIVIPSQPNVNLVDLAVDSLGGLLFWSCSIQNVINITRVDNSSVAGVVVQDMQEKPRLIALHPTKRLLFYTDVAQTPKIIKRKMDGSDKKIIAYTINITAFAIDYENDIIVWTQGNNIYKCNLDGSNQSLMLKETKSDISHLTVLSGWLYWLDREYLRRIEVLTGKSRSVIVERESDISDLIAVSEPDRKHLCADLHSCSHLCILNGTKAVCACPQGLVLQEDRKTCAVLPDCGVDRFTCSAQVSGNKECIPSTWKCDGQIDCQDASDETGCPACKPNQFRCNNGDCIDADFFCDSFAHCKDKSDEAFCCKSPQEFQCPHTNVCILKTFMCDGIEHCANGEDEKKSLCAERMPYSSGIMGLSGIFIWIFMTILSIIVILAVYFYMKRGGYTNTLGVIDQSEDPLNPDQNQVQIKLQKMRNKVPDVVHMSMLSGAQGGYDRGHITGASSSTNASSVACYPRETLNPPPSPATTAISTRASSPSQRYKPYKHYKSINQPPPPTPCSTDVCDESDYYTTNCNRSRYDDRSRYDLGPFPPPPTPRSQCNSDSCTPSPSSRSSTYFSPLPPPPSPVTSPQRNYDS